MNSPLLSSAIWFLSTHYKHFQQAFEVMYTSRNIVLSKAIFYLNLVDPRYDISTLSYVFIKGMHKDVVFEVGRNTRTKKTYLLNQLWKETTQKWTTNSWRWTGRMKHLLFCEWGLDLTTLGKIWLEEKSYPNENFVSITHRKTQSGSVSDARMSMSRCCYASVAFSSSSSCFSLPPPPQWIRRCSCWASTTPIFLKIIFSKTELSLKFFDCFFF